MYKWLAIIICFLGGIVLGMAFIACEQNTDSTNNENNKGDDGSGNNVDSYECYQMTCKQSEGLAEVGDDNVCEEAALNVEEFCTDDRFPDFYKCLCECAEMGKSSGIFDCFYACLKVFCIGSDCSYLKELEWAAYDCGMTFNYIAAAEMIASCNSCLGQCASGYGIMENNECGNFTNCADGCFK